MIIASSAFRHATRFYPEAERGRFSIPIEITIRLIIGLIVLSADLSTALSPSFSFFPRFNGQALQRRRVYTLRVCRFLRKRIASRAPRFMGPWAVRPG